MKTIEKSSTTDFDVSQQFARPRRDSISLFSGIAVQRRLISLRFHPADIPRSLPYVRARH